MQNQSYPASSKDIAHPADKLMHRLVEYFQSAKDYAAENPRETALLATTIGLATWALLFTRPGRQLFDKGTTLILPKASDWIVQNFPTESATMKH